LHEAHVMGGNEYGDWQLTQQVDQCPSGARVDGVGLTQRRGHLFSVNVSECYRTMSTR
jgi:hypothetical protein